MDDTLPIVMPKKPLPKQKRAERPRKLITKTDGLWPWQSPQFTSREKYRAYIESPHWKMKRDCVIALAGRACEHCQNKTHLTVHHVHYKTLFSEGNEDLMCLCWTCHKKVQSNAKDKPSILAFLAIARPLEKPLAKRKAMEPHTAIFERAIADAEENGFRCVVRLDETMAETF